MLTERVEAVLNRQATGSPRAQALLAQLEGRALRIEATFTPLLLELRSDGTALRLLRNPDGEPDARMSGTPLALLGLLRANPEEAIRSGSVTITGDAELANRFRELLQLLRPEVEEELSRVIGDAPAHTLGRLVSGALGWTRNAGATTLRNVGEYLAHERGDLVPQAEAADFLAGVDRLREDVDRLAARVAQLESRDAPRP